MKALVYHGNKDVRCEDIQAFSGLGPRDVYVKVKCAGLCHTDFNEYLHGPIYISRTPHVRTKRSIPIVIGHEFSGEVLEIGREVGRIKVGDRVAINAVDSCRTCFYCRKELYALCPTAAYIGFGRDGGFAEFSIVPEHCCYCLPTSVSYEAGALVEPFSVALHAVKQSQAKMGDRAAIVGGGAIGLCALQVLRAAGVRDVYVFERSSDKARFSQQLGAAAVINPDTVNPKKAIADHTGGEGADITFECVGSAAALYTAVNVTRGAGVICILGVFPEPVELDLNGLMSKEKRLITSLAYGEEFSTVIALLADGRLKAEPLITHKLPLIEAVEKGLVQFETLAAKNVRTIIEVEA